MGTKFNFFQLALLAFFGLMAIGSVIYIAMFKPDDTSTSSSSLKDYVVIWGPPATEEVVTKAVIYLKEKDPSYAKVIYRSKNQNTIYTELLESIASGIRTPDIVILKSSNLLTLKNKLYPVSFDLFSYNLYRDTWVQGSEIFVLQNNIYAFPFLVDPLVLYWNRDLFTNAAIAQSPKDWITLKKIVPRLNTIVGDTDLVQSAIALGEYDNVLHAKEIISALLMQTGVGFVRHDSGRFFSDFKKMDNNPEAAINFFTAFSNPGNVLYSWNKTFDRSREAFASNKVAMYAGFVSEEKTLQQINPNLNYGISTWPQSDNKYPDVTYGYFYGLGIVKSSKNIADAYKVIMALTSSQTAEAIVKQTSLLPARNDLLTNFDPSDPNGDTKVRSVIMARSWLEPAPSSAVEEIFSSSINSVISGKSNAGNAIEKISTDIGVLLKEHND